jgi:transposase
VRLPRGLHRLDHRSRSPACRWCPQKNGPQALGRSRGGLTTKIHVVVDAIGRLIQGRLSAGQVHDVTQASALLDGVPAQCVMADKAYDSDELRRTICDAGAKAVIPPRANRRRRIRWSKAIYRHRNLIERFLCRIKHFRRIANRYEKLAERFASFICLVSAFVSVRQMSTGPRYQPVPWTSRSRG